MPGNFNLRNFYYWPFSIFLIFCLGILAYSNTLYCSFHFDDFRFIADNLAIRNIHDLLSIWKFFPCRFVTFFSFAASYHFYHLNVFGYHLFNLAIHLCSAVLVWWFTQLTLSTPALRENKIIQHANLFSLFVGLLFVSHPVQTEAVTYIWQRAASMATMFYLLSLCLYVKSRMLVGEGLKPSPANVYYICSIIIAIVAMFTKETAITLPLIILIYEFTFINNKVSLHWKRLLPFLVIMFIVPLLTLINHSEKVQYIQGSVEGLGEMSRMQYFLTQFRVMFSYIRLVFLPINQNFDYDYTVYSNIFELPVFISILSLITILFCAKSLFSKYRLISFSIFWFFLTLLPESLPFPRKDVIFEHRLYLPLVGGSIFFVSSMYYLFAKKSLKFTGLAMIMIITLFSVLTYQRNKVWRDDMSLWGDVVKKFSHKARGYNILGVAYINKGNYVQAMLNFNKAVEISPNLSEALSNRGASYLHQGNFIQALADYNKAIKADSSNVRAYYGRATTFCFLKKYDEAWADVQRIKNIGNSDDFQNIYKLVKEFSNSESGGLLIKN